MYSAISGWFRPQIASTNIEKLQKKVQKFDFSKINILKYSGQKCDIWPKIGPLEPRKHSEAPYWPFHFIWVNFWKIEKNHIFDLKNYDKIFSMADFSGRWGPATKPILGIDTSYWCPKSPVISLYSSHPLLLKSYLLIPIKMRKNVFFHDFA